MRALDLRDFTLAVHATAGTSALEMAVRERERVRGLVISNTFAWPLDEEAGLQWIVRIVGSRAFGFINVNLNLLPTIAARWGRRNGRFSGEERAAIAGPYRRPETRRHLQNLLVGIRTEREMFKALRARLSVFKSRPTLFLYRAHDNGYKAGFLERWKQLLPCHRAVILADSGHFPLEDEPERFTSELRRWLEERAR